MSKVPMTTINGHEELRYPGNVNMSFAHVEGESLLMVSSLPKAPIIVYALIYALRCSRP